MSSNRAARQDFYNIIQFELRLFLNATREFPLPLRALADMVHRAFDAELSFIEGGLTTPHAQRGRLSNALDQLARCIHDIEEFRDQNRHVKEFFNHLAAIAECIGALRWVTSERDPAGYVRVMREAGEYFGNRVMTTYKHDTPHENWWRYWLAVMDALENYVRTHHLEGFNYARELRSPHTIPPAPPLPPPQEPNPTGGAGDLSDEMRNALLNQINQGVGIVGMLRPVRPVAQGPRALIGMRGEPAAPVEPIVHEPAFVPQAPVAAPPVPRAPAPVAAPAVPQAPAPVAAPAVPQAPAAAPAILQAQRLPKFLLEGRKWRVEYQRCVTGLTVTANEMSETLAMFQCENTELEVTNKINGATLDNVKRGTVVFRDVISTVELIRCQRITIQCIGHVPSINLDSCDSIQIFLSKDSRDTEIITSKTSSLNVCLLGEDGDYVELPVPEQIRTTVVNGSLQSSVIQQI